MDAATTGSLPQWWLHLIAGSDGSPAAANRSTGSCFDVEPERPKIPAVLGFSSLHPRGVSSRGARRCAWSNRACSANRAVASAARAVAASSMYMTTIW